MNWKKPDPYQLAGLCGFFLVIVFHILDYAYFKLPDFTRYFVSFVIILVPVIIAIILKARRDESSRVRAARGLGRVLSHDAVSLSFERDGAIFRWEPVFKEHQAAFYLPAVKEKFSIQHYAGTSPASILEQIMTNQNQNQFFDDCQLIRNSPLSGDMILHSRNPEFLLFLLKNPKINTEIAKYLPDRFGITFNDGKFEIGWETGSNEELEHFYQICQTAILFHDELKKI